MTSANSTSWEKELRKNICTNFGRGIRVNGENSGRTKLLYVYNEGLGSANKRTSQTLPIEWKKTSGIEILKAIEFIKSLVAKPEVGKIYKGKVVKIMEFGAFVNFLGKQDGLVHISELANKRVAKVGDVVKEGDEVSVKVVGFDRGKVKLSMKQASA